MKYKIKFFNGNPEMSGLSLDEVTNFKINNLDKIGEFKILEDSENAESNEKWRKRTEFKKTLSPIQLSDLESGEVELRYSVNDEKWYLRRTVEDEIHISLQNQDEKNRIDRIKKKLKDVIKGMEEELIEQFEIFFPEEMATSDEIKSLISRITYIVK